MKNLIILSLVIFVITMGYFAYVTDAPAYAGKAPETCNNCHAMHSQYENWYHSAHREWALCTDCHLPHDNLAVYYLEKGRQGLKDTFAFTIGAIPVAMRASPQTKEIIQGNCIRCHAAALVDILTEGQEFDRHCWECHRAIAHGSRGISFSPYQDSSLYPIE